MSTRSRPADLLKRFTKLPFQLVLMAWVLLSTARLASSRPSASDERPALIELQAQPMLREAYWGVANKALKRPLWFALLVEDLKGSRLAGVKVVINCDSPARLSRRSFKRSSKSSSQPDFSGFTEEDGWLFGALPSECERSSAWGLSPARWWVSLGGSPPKKHSSKKHSSKHQTKKHRDSTRVEKVLFKPRHLHGAWEVSKLSLREGYLHYTLSHTSRVPHKLSAQLTWRPCLSSELTEEAPSPYPPHLLTQSLNTEGLQERSLGEPTAPGARKLSLWALKAPVGCYVLSARSSHLPWSQLLEARSLYHLKASLTPSVSHIQLDPTRLSLQGELSASPFHQQALKRRLTRTGPEGDMEVTLALNLEGRLMWPKTPHSAEQSMSDGEWSLIDQVNPTLSSRADWTWSLNATLPDELIDDSRISSHERGDTHLELRLTLNETTLTHSAEVLITPQPLPPLPWWRHTYIITLTSLMSLIILGLLTLITRRTSAKQAHDETLEPTEEPTLEPLTPLWSPEPLRDAPLSAHTASEEGAVMLHVTLVDALSRSPLSGEVALSLPPPLLSDESAEAPQSAPERALGASEGVERPLPSPHRSNERLSNELTLLLSTPILERLREGEVVWLWGLAEGYESAVSEVRFEHMNGHLTLPLWPVREAVKRSLTALCEVEGLRARFGRAALAEIRDQLKGHNPSLPPVISTAEEVLYGDRPPSAQGVASLCWALSGGRLSRALPPHDARARRVTSVVRLTSLLLWLSLSLWGGPSEALAQGGVSSVSPQTSFRPWLELTSKACGQPAPLKTTITLSELSAHKHLAMLNPNVVPHQLIEWVKKGGRLLIALEPEGARRSAHFLKRLDLSFDEDLGFDKEGVQQLEGLWWAQGTRGAEHLPPFVGRGLTRFVEGSSWFEPELPPVWLDERGASLGYRVGLGRGTLILIGDSNTLQSDLIEGRDNHIAALTLLEWLLNTQRHGAQQLSQQTDQGLSVVGSHCPLTLVSPATIEGLSDSSDPLEPLKKQLSELGCTLLEKLKALLKALSQIREHPFLLQLTLALILGVWLTRLTKRLKAQRVRIRPHERRAPPSPTRGPPSGIYPPQPREPTEPPQPTAPQ